jgi:hypothetical protein
MSQGTLFADASDIARHVRTVVIARKRDFESLFEGYTELLAVTYVATAGLLVELLERRGFDRAEVLLGDSLATSEAEAERLRSELASGGPDAADRLLDKVESGALTILLPERPVHTKLYILKREGSVRVINTSANLTETARQARQVNYAWYLDLPAGDPFVAKVVADFRRHCEGARTFMGDLVELLKKEDVPRREVVEAWLKGAVVEDEESEARRYIQEISAKAVLPASGEEEPIITLRLPEGAPVRKYVEKALGGLSRHGAPGEININGLAWLRYVEESHEVPVFQVHRESRRLLAGLNGTRVCLTAEPPDAASLDSALAHIEDYIGTVDLGQTTDPAYAKTAMCEALLYVFFAPFAVEYMRVRRAAYASVDMRGPRFLYVYGPSQNGKSTFLRFALKLVSGGRIQPLSGSLLTKTRLQQAAALGTVFPLVFDDVVGMQSTPNVEEAVKSYWEVWWRSDTVQPQVVFSSNQRSLKDWAKSRVKRVDFDVHFAPSERNKVRLARLFEVENPLFTYFTRAYFRQLDREAPVSDDELYLARAAMLDLYERASRPVPAWFPREPLEKTYDPGLRDWHDLLYGIKKARTARESGRLLVRFDPDMPRWDIAEYETHLPQTVKKKLKGNTLVIESPTEFERWLAGAAPPPRSLWSRLLRSRA